MRNICELYEGNSMWIEQSKTCKESQLRIILFSQKRALYEKIPGIWGAHGKDCTLWDCHILNLQQFGKMDIIFQLPEFVSQVDCGTRIPGRCAANLSSTVSCWLLRCSEKTCNQFHFCKSQEYNIQSFGKQNNGHAKLCTIYTLEPMNVCYITQQRGTAAADGIKVAYQMILQQEDYPGRINVVGVLKYERIGIRRQSSSEAM